MTNPTTPNPDKQDWKEKVRDAFVYMRKYVDVEELIKFFDSDIIQPLQSQNDYWKKEAKDYHEKFLIIHKQFLSVYSQKEALQKENGELKSEVKACHDDITFLHKERDELKQKYDKLVNTLSDYYIVKGAKTV